MKAKVTFIAKDKVQLELEAWEYETILQCLELAAHPDSHFNLHPVLGLDVEKSDARRLHDSISKGNLRRTES